MTVQLHSFDRLAARVQIPLEVARRYGKNETVICVGFLGEFTDERLKTILACADHLHLKNESAVSFQRLLPDSPFGSCIVQVGISPEIASKYGDTVSRTLTYTGPLKSFTNENIEKILTIAAKNLITSKSRENERRNAMVWIGTEGVKNFQEYTDLLKELGISVRFEKKNENEDMKMS